MKTRIQVRWHAAEGGAAVALMLDRLRRAAQLLAERTRRELSARSSEAGRSRPGESPARETGDLAGSVFTEETPRGARVGAAAEHAAFLELGTSRMAARPFLRPTLAESWDELRGIVLGAD